MIKKSLQRRSKKITHNYRNQHLPRSYFFYGSRRCIFSLDTWELMFSEVAQAMPRKDYEYPDKLIFLRDVDERPLLLKEKELKKE